MLWVGGGLGWWHGWWCGVVWLGVAIRWVGPQRVCLPRRLHAPRGAGPVGVLHRALQVGGWVGSCAEVVVGAWVALCP